MLSKKADAYYKIDLPDSTPMSTSELSRSKRMKYIQTEVSDEICYLPLKGADDPHRSSTCFMFHEV